MAQVILYGIGKAEEQYRAISYYALYEESISSMKYYAKIMMEKFPNIEHVYAIDNRYGLKQEYMESIKKYTIELCYEFKDTLEREGLLII